MFHMMKGFLRCMTCRERPILFLKMHGPRFFRMQRMRQILLQTQGTPTAAGMMICDAPIGGLRG